MILTVSATDRRGGGEVELDGLTPGFSTHLIDRPVAKSAAATTGDEEGTVDPSQFGSGGFERPFRLTLVTEVRPGPAGTSSLGDDLACQRSALRLVERDHEDGGTLGGEATCPGGSDPAGAGDNDGVGLRGASLRSVSLEPMDLEYPGFGTIVVDGERFDHDVVLEDGAVRPRDKRPSKQFKSGHTPLSVAEDIPWSRQRLVVGSGHSGSLPVMSEVHDEAQRRGVELVVLPTAEACALLRDLDPADANAILHVTC